MSFPNNHPLNRNHNLKTYFHERRRHLTFSQNKQCIGIFPLSHSNYRKSTQSDGFSSVIVSCYSSWLAKSAQYHVASLLGFGIISMFVWVDWYFYFEAKSKENLVTILQGWKHSVYTIWRKTNGDSHVKVRPIVTEYGNISPLIAEHKPYVFGYVFLWSWITTINTDFVGLEWVRCGSGDGIRDP